MNKDNDKKINKLREEEEKEFAQEREDRNVNILSNINIWWTVGIIAILAVFVIMWIFN